jgi:uncharacterized membrane protein
MEAKSSVRLPGSIFVFLVVYSLLQARLQHSKLPEVIATHFRAGGLANGWQTQSHAFTTGLTVIALAALIGFGVPQLVGVIPVSLTNLPNKEYWLAPERRENTLAYLKTSFAWFGCALLTFLLFVNELVFRANLVKPQHLNTTAFVTAIFTFLGFVLVWTARLIVHFSKGDK